MYCVLRQTEIDSSVFGTADNHHKNIKRRYVFEILYGLYDPEAAGLRERLREVTTELNALTADADTLERILASSAFSSRAQLEAERSQTEQQLAHTYAAGQDLSGELNTLTTAHLRAQVSDADAELAKIDTAIHAETTAAANLRSLHDQLIAQSRRLTRALVAERLLNDFEFHTCPRCGSAVPERGDDDTCRLCLQTPPTSPSPAALAAEQDRVIEQVAETGQLIERSGKRLDDLQVARTSRADRRRSLGAELDRAMATYVTDQTDRIRSQAAEQARLEEHLRRIDDALSLHTRLQGQADSVAKLEREKGRLNDLIDASRRDTPGVAARLKELEKSFEKILRAFDAPRFDDRPGSYIDRKTYLPVVDGRGFMDLQSQGVEVLVNVAHVLAHQQVALDDDTIPLPNLLIIDGISSNVGHEGVDLHRLRKMYTTLYNAASDDLQIIVTDNDPPPITGIHKALELSDTDRFVPGASSLFPRDGVEPAEAGGDASQETLY
ncbi:hypothetical protein [Streptomyces hygroscopicus]|uniref:hypothetical protein n=1 Tax=Streptomyces hygroscopicus TaxID=1912 RepID=UPI00368D6BBA